MACKVCATRIKVAAKRPAAAAAGTEPTAERAARARRKGWEGLEDPVSAPRLLIQARPRTPEPAGKRWRAQARAASPRLQPPPTQFHALLPAPFFSREGRAVARGPFASPPQRRRSVSPGGGAGRGGAPRGAAGCVRPHLRSTPPSSEALRHSGGERRRCTSATVTLYFEVELRSERRPGTEQKTSLGFTTPPKRLSLLMGMADTALLLDLDRDTGPVETDQEAVCGVEDPTQVLPELGRPAPRLEPQTPLFFQP